MWPMLLDMSRDECKRLLRRLELEAYSSVVTALRAQGFLSKEKRKMLQDLASALSISLERHRAEVRRAVNDEKLATIAEHMAGPNTSSEWAIEGRRLIPLMPRLVPQTAFTVFANKMANITASENAKLPLPSRTPRAKGTREEHIGFVEPHHRQPVGISSANSSANMHLPRSAPSQLLLGKRSVGSQQTCPEGITKRPRFSDCATIPRQVKVTPASTPHVPVKRLEEQVSQLPSHLQSNSQFQPHHHSHAPVPQDRVSQPINKLQSHSSLRIQPQPQSHNPSQPPTPLQVQMITHNQTHSQSVPDPSSQPAHSHLPQAEEKHQHHQQQQQQQLRQPAHQPPLPHLQQQLQKQQDQQQHKQQPKQPEQRLQQEEQQQQQQQHLLLNTSSEQSPSPSSPLVGARPSLTGTPVKITLTSGVSRPPACTLGLTNTTPTITTTSAPTTQKVIIVQSTAAAAAASSGQPGILQRSLSVPVASRSASLVISGHSNSSTPVTPTTIVTISTNPGASGMSIPGRVLGRSAPVPDDILRPAHAAPVRSLSALTVPGATPRLRPKAATAVLSPSRLRPRTASIVIPVTPNAAAGVPGVSLRPTRPKHEGGAMKIVPVPTPAVGAAKILPKPAYSSAGNARSSSSSSSNSVVSPGASGPTPMYMMSTTTSTITMMTRTVPATSVAGAGARMVTVSATTLPVASVAPAAGRPAKAASGKPNVIVVQKGSGTSFPRGVALSGAGRVQGLSTSLQEVLSKVVTSKTLAASASGGQQGITVHKTGGPGLNLPVVSGQTGNVLVLDLSHENVNKNMVLADILQASGITGEPESPPLPEKDARTESEENSTTQPPRNEQGVQSKAAQSQPRTVVEVIGELDPQTGIYSLHPNPVSGDPDRSLSSNSTIGVSCGDVSSTSVVDIFNTALASADINLDSFHYMEESPGAETGPELSASGSVNLEGAQEHSGNEPLHFLSQTTNEPLAVTVEPSHIDTTAMHIEDFTSQKIQESTAME